MESRLLENRQMSTPSQKAQDGPGQAQSESQGEAPVNKGSSILARLRAGEQVPGYRLVKGRLEREDKQMPVVKEPGEFDRLTAMRHVLANPASADKTPGQKWCRQWMEKSPGPFGDAYDRLELEAKKAAAGKNAAEEEVLEPTESDEELAQAIKELIQKHLPKGK